MSNLLFQTLNPATGKLVDSFDYHSDQELDLALEKSKRAYESWKFSPMEQRIKVLLQLGELLENNASSLAKTLAVEMGKPLAQGEGEAKKCASLCRYYSENGEEFLRDQIIKTQAQKSFVSFRPIGVIFSIMPWNFPLWQVIRFAAPSLLAGNTVLLKHAPNVPKTALALEKLFLEAGFPQDTFISVRPSLEQMEKIFSHKTVQGISFTGSTLAGKKIATLAGANLKKSVLELGGSDPYIIFADADIEQTVESCVASRMVNSGQSCVAAKRFLVHESIAPKFTEAFAAAMQKQTFDDPLKNPSMGPLARIDLRDQLHKQVQESIAQGAKVVCGGNIPNMQNLQQGFYYPPTVLTNISNNMSTWQQETFGPVAAIQTFSDEQDAIDIANDSLYGLGAALFGADVEHLTKLAKENIEAGSVAVNDFVKSDPRLPFGGIKESGYGRELSIFGLHEFVNIKSVVVK